MSSETMRAVVWEGKVGQVAVRSVPRPKLQLPEDAIVRMTSSGICGSDLHTYRGYLGSVTPPWVMGHEGMGVVVEVGSATEHVKVGDRVLVPANCDSGSLSVENTMVMRETLFGFGEDFGGTTEGLQAEYARVTSADDTLVVIPDDFSSDIDWLFLSDIFCTAWTGLDFAKFQGGDGVVIFGLGGVGLLCVYSAMLRGASRVYAVDHVRERLDKATSLGAIPIDFTSDEGSASEQILRREPNGLERVVDCVGQECVNRNLKLEQNYVLQEAIRIVCWGGGISLTGFYGSVGKSAGAPLGDVLKSNLSVATGDAWLKGVSIGTGIVTLQYFEILPRLFDLVKSGRANTGFIVSDVIDIEEAPEAYARFNDWKETKVVIQFNWNRPGGVVTVPRPMTAIEESPAVNGANAESGLMKKEVKKPTIGAKPRSLLFRGMQARRGGHVH